MAMMVLADHLVVLILPDVGNERAIDFQLIDRQSFEIRQRRIADTEIVHGELHAHRRRRSITATVAPTSSITVPSVSSSTMRWGRDAKFRQQMFDIENKIVCAELSRTDIHGQLGRRDGPAIQPPAIGGHRRAQDPAP